MNYSKPQGAELSDLAQKVGNPVVIYNPKELQMNTAFSKAFLLDEGGSKAGLPGNYFYIDESVVNAVIEYSEDKGYSPIQEKTDEGLFLFIPYKDNNPHKVVMGFCFDSEMIIPQGIKYKAFKCIISNTCYRIRDCDAGKTFTVTKCIISNTGNRITN